MKLISLLNFLLSEHVLYQLFLLKTIYKKVKEGWMSRMRVLVDLKLDVFNGIVRNRRL